MRPEEIIRPVVDKFQEKVAVFVRQRQEAFTSKGFGEFVACLRILMAEVGRDLFRRMVEAQEEWGATVTKDGRVYRLKDRYPKEWLTPFGTAGSFGTPGAPNPPCVENVDGGSRADVSVAD